MVLSVEVQKAESSERGWRKVTVVATLVCGPVRASQQVMEGGWKEGNESWLEELTEPCLVLRVFALSLNVMCACKV